MPASVLEPLTRRTRTRQMHHLYPHSATEVHNQARRQKGLSTQGVSKCEKRWQAEYHTALSMQRRHLCLEDSAAVPTTKSHATE